MTHKSIEFALYNHHTAKIDLQKIDGILHFISHEKNSNFH